MGRKGFTLTEVLVTIVVLAVVAGLAIPTYSESIERSRENEAIVNLNAIYMAQKIHRVKFGAFHPNGTLDAAAINADFDLDISTNFYGPNFVISDVDASNFTVTVARNDGDSLPEISINQAGVIDIRRS